MFLTNETSQTRGGILAGEASDSTRASRASKGARSGKAGKAGKRGAYVGRSTGDVGDHSAAPKPGDQQPEQPDLLRSDKLYYRIGEVSAITGVKAHVLRYWETEFRWMAPPKSRANQRLYRKRDIEMVLLLKRLLWEERYTIAGARQKIQEMGAKKALEAEAAREDDSEVSGAASGLDAARATAMRSELSAIAESLREIRAAL